MPITPLHFGVPAPINHHPGKVSNVSFVLANVWMDAHSIIYTLTGYGAISHDDHVWWALPMTPLIGIFQMDAGVVARFVGCYQPHPVGHVGSKTCSPFDQIRSGKPVHLC